MLKHLAHDLRGYLMPILSNAVLIAKVPAETPMALQRITRNAQGMEMVLDAVRDAKFETFNVAAFHAMITESVRAIEQSRTDVPHITIEALPDETDLCCILTGRVAWVRALLNIIDNAARKQATNVVISVLPSTLQRQNHPCIEVIVRDDGVGMRPEILKSLREGRQVSDRDLDGALPPGDQVHHHGHGIASIRQFIEEVSLGELEIESTQATDGDPTHGTSIIIRLPIINGNAVPAEDSSKYLDEAVDVPATIPILSPSDESAPEDYSRRHALMVGGAMATTLAAAGGIFWALRSGSNDAENKHAPRFPLRSFAIDPDGRASFELTVADRQLHCVHGRATELQDVTHVALGQDVLVGCSADIAGQREEMFFCHLPEGLFAFVRDGESVGYLCIPRQLDGALATAQESLFPLQDALYDGSLFATNAELLRSRQLQTLAAPLRRIVQAPQPVASHERRRLHLARNILVQLLSSYDHCQRGARPVQTSDEWEQCVRDSQQTFLIVESPVQQQLLSDARAPQHVQRLRTRQNDLCFLDTTIQQAQRLIRI
jgi:hypothetical protein